MNMIDVKATISEVDADSPASRGNRSVVVSLPNQSPTLLLGLLVLGLLISGLQT